jgi:hypothetical protein
MTNVDNLIVEGDAAVQASSEAMRSAALTAPYLLYPAGVTLRAVGTNGGHPDGCHVLSIALRKL